MHTVPGDLLELNHHHQCGFNEGFKSRAHARGRSAPDGPTQSRRVYGARGATTLCHCALRWELGSWLGNCVASSEVSLGATALGLEAWVVVAALEVRRRGTVGIAWSLSRVPRAHLSVDGVLGAWLGLLAPVRGFSEVGVLDG